MTYLQRCRDNLQLKKSKSCPRDKRLNDFLTTHFGVKSFQVLKGGRVHKIVECTSMTKGNDGLEEGSMVFLPSSKGSH